MKKSKWFVLWILVLLVILAMGGMIIFTGLSDYLNGTQLPHHSKNLAQSMVMMLC